GIRDFHVTGVQTCALPILDTLLDEVAKYLPVNEPMFEEDTITDRSMRFIAAELLREKIFRLVGDELPYGCAVMIEQWEENETGRSEERRVGKGWRYWWST